MNYLIFTDPNGTLIPYVVPYIRYDQEHVVLSNPGYVNRILGTTQLLQPSKESGWKELGYQQWN